jgi:hypothetical protein
MGGVTVHGAPGLPGGALDSSAPGAYLTSVLSTDKQGLKRSYETFAQTESRPSNLGPATKNDLFDPDVHLAYEPPMKVYTMEDLTLPAGNGVSPVAVSEPFPLFSEEAINRMRTEVLSDVVMEQYSYTSDIAPKQLRGYAPK